MGATGGLPASVRVPISDRHARAGKLPVAPRAEAPPLPPPEVFVSSSSLAHRSCYTDIATPRLTPAPASGIVS
jgi:hypothetical protein